MVSHAVNTEEESQVSFDLSAYPVGIYFAHLLENDQILAQEKVVLLR